MILPIIEITCQNCSTLFYICRNCFRGHRYCCEQCRKKQRYIKQQKARKKYRQSPNGKKVRGEAENRRRQRLLKKNREIAKNVGHHSSISELKRCNVPKKDKVPAGFKRKERGYCGCCGQTGVVVSEFGRQDYGRVQYTPLLKPIWHTTIKKM